MPDRARLYRLWSGYDTNRRLFLWSVLFLLAEHLSKHIPKPIALPPLDRVDGRLAIELVSFELRIRPVVVRLPTGEEATLPHHGGVLPVQNARDFPRGT